MELHGIPLLVVLVWAGHWGQRPFQLIPRLFLEQAAAPQPVRSSAWSPSPSHRTVIDRLCAGDGTVAAADAAGAFVRDLHRAYVVKIGKAKGTFEYVAPEHARPRRVLAACENKHD